MAEIEFVCKAYISSSGIRCERCRYLYDPAMPDPPRCLKDSELGQNDPLVPFFKRAFAHMEENGALKKS